MSTIDNLDIRLKRIEKLHLYGFGVIVVFAIGYLAYKGLKK